MCPLPSRWKSPGSRGSGFVSGGHSLYVLKVVFNRASDLSACPFLPPPSSPLPVPKRHTGHPRPPTRPVRAAGLFQGHRSCLECGRQHYPLHSAQLPMQRSQRPITGRSCKIKFKMKGAAHGNVSPLVFLPTSPSLPLNSLGTPEPSPFAQSRVPSRDPKHSPRAERAALLFLPILIAATIYRVLLCAGARRKHVTYAISCNPWDSRDAGPILITLLHMSKPRHGKEAQGGRFQTKARPSATGLSLRLWCV